MNRLRILMLHLYGWNRVKHLSKRNFLYEVQCLHSKQQGQHIEASVRRKLYYLLTYFLSLSPVGRVCAIHLLRTLAIIGVMDSGLLHCFINIFACSSCQKRDERLKWEGVLTLTMNSYPLRYVQFCISQCTEQMERWS